MLRLQKICLLALVLLLGGCASKCEDEPVVKETFCKRMYTYKTLDGREYQLEIFFPVGGRQDAKRPAIVWWSGGAWRWGGLGVYERQCLPGFPRHGRRVRGIPASGGRQTLLGGLGR